MDVSRKEWLAEKSTHELQERIRKSAQRMKMGFAVIGTSVLISNLAGPAHRIMAEEKVVERQKETRKYAENPFLNSLIPSASVIAQKNDLYASVMMAQAVLESGWGTSKLASEPNHNLFGIKGEYEGSSVNMNTLEDSGNQNYYEIQANFRKYPSYHESLEDYASLLRNGTDWDPLFYSGTWKSNTSNYQDATAYLTGRYATDTAYASKLNQIIEKNNLAVYDTPSEIVPEESVIPSQPTEPEAVGKGESYVVQKGDTLYGIAGKYNISLTELMTWNHLDSSLLHPGDVLTVSQKSITEDSSANTESSTTHENSTSDQDKGSLPSASYQVKTGDSLWRISQKNGVTVAQLKQWNQLKSDIIQPGQVLVLDTSENKDTEKETSTPSNSTENQAVSGKGTAVTVKSGDTLYRIASQAGVSVTDLKAWNQLKTDLIYPGQKLYLQGKESQPTDSSQNTDTPSVPSQSTSTSESPDSVQTEAQTEYIVAKGDTLYRIAHQYDVTVSQLKEWNGLESDLIAIGQKLAVQSTSRSAEEKEETSDAFYVIQKDDTLYSIAKRYDISLKDLMEKNSLNSSLIYVGQQLKVK